MCQKPSRVKVVNAPSDRFIEVQCGKCWACLKNAENDLIGRCLCEIPLATSSWYMTLTYDDRKLSRGSKQATHIHKADLQNFFKRVRKRGHNLRYVASAETGTRFTKRVHFHVIALWQGLPPVITKYWNGKDALQAWPWGHVDIDKTVNAQNLRYVCKYLTKSKRDKDKAPLNAPVLSTGSWVTYSKKPVMGAEYVVNLASSYASKRLMPRNLRYQPPAGNPNNHYSLSGAAERLFLDTFYGLWPEAADKPKTEWMHNATLRWSNYHAEKCWRALPATQQKKLLKDQMREKPLQNKTLSKADRMRYAWAGYDAQERFRQWREQENLSQIARLTAAQARVLSEFGISLPSTGCARTDLNAIQAFLAAERRYALTISNTSRSPL